MRYRPEVDGLRAIAVLAVVVYHAELTLFGSSIGTGGFVGVDVFFVISGYLISTLIYEELDRTGGFSLAGFYERRARRILPALLVVILACLPFAWMLLLPSSLTEFAHSIVAALLFYANIFFFFSTSEYGAEWSLLKPLLHTWSLSVEEQFYLFFPFLAVALHKSRWSHGKTLAVIALASFVFAVFMAERNVNLNFYLLPSRIWELLAGVMVARLMRHELPTAPWQHLKLANLGLFLIVVPVFLFSDATPHPSFPTLLPVVGTVLLLLFARPTTGVGWVLASKPFVAVGLISYSLYLWHYPAFAFLRLWLGEPSNSAFLAVTIICLLLSCATYRFIEQPFLQRTVFPAKAVFRSLGYGSVSFALIAAVIINQRGSFGQFDHLRAVLPNYEVDNGQLQLDRSAYNELQILRSKYRAETGRILIVGNSHAKDVFAALKHNESLFPDVSTMMYDIQLGCFEEDREEVESFFASTAYLEADMLLIAPRYASGRRCRVGEAHWTNDFTGLDALLASAVLDGKQVTIVKNTVEFADIDGKPLVDALVGRVLPKTREEADSLFTRINQHFYDARFSARAEVVAINRQLELAARKFDAILLDREAFQCVAHHEMCFGVTPDGHKVYYDYGHFTLAGAAFMGKRMAELDWLAPVYARLGLD